MDTFSFAPVNGGAFGHLGPAAGVAYNPAAPPDEQSAAEREVLALYGGDPRSVLGGDLFAAVEEFALGQVARASAGTASRPLAKSLGWTRPGSASPKARTEPLLARLGGTGAGRWLPKVGMPFRALRVLARRVEVAQSIIRQRQRHIMAFCDPSLLDSQPGWMLGAADQKAELSDDHREYLDWLAQVLGCGGRAFDPLTRRRKKRQEIRTFLTSLASDSLILDHAAVETVPLRGAMGLDSFYCRDSATFYLACEEDERQGIYCFQDLELADILSFRFEEMAIFQRNPLTDLDWNGYTYGELEAGLDTISTLLSAFAYTRESLDNNAIPRGILTVSGQFTQETWQQFDRAWRQKLLGAANAHSLPVLRSQAQGDVKFVPTGAPVSEMAYAKWISLQVAILTSLYGMDPSELGMEGFTSGSVSSLSGSDTGERLASAKDKGLRPLLRDISAFISDHILARFTKTPWVRFRFTGLDRMDEAAAEAERTSVMSVDEVRSKHGMEPYPIAWVGALPRDPGLQAAEHQRITETWTLGEARAATGVPAYPDVSLNSAPLNPTMGALYMGVLQARAAEAQEGQQLDQEHFDEAGGFGQPGADDAPGGPPEDGLAGDVHSRLTDLGPAPEEADDGAQGA